MAAPLGLLSYEVPQKVTALRGARLLPTSADWQNIRCRGVDEFVASLAHEYARALVFGLAGSFSIGDATRAVLRLSDLRSAEPADSGSTTGRDPPLWLVLDAALRCTATIDALVLSQRCASAVVLGFGGGDLRFGAGWISGPSYTITGAALAEIGVAVRECLL